MTIRSAHHSGLYYPQQSALRSAQAKPLEPIEASAKAVLLPHAAWPYVLSLIHQVLCHTRTQKRSLIVVLAPYHGAEKKRPIAITAAKRLELEGLTITLADEAARDLARKEAVVVDESAFDDESSWELLMPLLDSYHPGCPILPILVPETIRPDNRTLTSLITHLGHTWPSALFVVTTNASAPLPSPDAEDQARSVAAALQDGAGHIPYGCNKAALESVSSCLGGQWRIIGMMSGGKSFDTIPSSLEMDDRHVWHLGALLE